MTLKIWALLVIIICIPIGCSKRKPTENPPNPSNTTPVNQEDIKPQYTACITCFIGEIGSDSNCSTTIAMPTGKVSNFEVTQKLSCGHPNKISDIEWNFIEHKDGKDLYNFKRTFPAGTNKNTTTSSIVGFDGSQIVIFQDEYHVIVMDTYAEE